MGYQIDYLPTKKIRGAERNRASLPCLTALCFLVFALLVNLYWPQGKIVLQRIVFPGKAAATAAALDSFADNMSSGVDAYQALLTFCKAVIQDEEAY